MQAFQFYVTDERHGVRSLVHVQTKDADSAHTMAERLLANIDYRLIEVWDGDDQLFALDAAIEGRPAKGPRRPWRASRSA